MELRLLFGRVDHTDALEQSGLIDLTYRCSDDITVFIDGDGNLITGAMGMIDEATLRRGIEMIMPQPAGGSSSTP